MVCLLELLKLLINFKDSIFHQLIVSALLFELKQKQKFVTQKNV